MQILALKYNINERNTIGIGGEFSSLKIHITSTSTLNIYQ
jgi:hypothetical protein